ncbi:MAG: Bax inhibitor-1/YccA family protein [Candidatus Omnitrophota bacterium]|nr:Bax inhibitor-1/YccA family protein [Candidatus Omnitrophota bacterium]MDZ4242938.1 Bax inhibitor-1/YccA family protein [Candidatus Omnitrophota bacterium]
MRTSNPALKAGMFLNARSHGMGETMTMRGTVNKCFILLALIVGGASWVWGKIMGLAEGTEPAQAAGYLMPLIFISLVVGGIIALVTVFNPSWSPVTAPVYAICEGFLLGGISAYYEMSYPGIVMQAVMLTFGTLLCMLTAYRSGLIQVTDKFRLGIVAATGAIMLVYLVSWVFSFFNVGIFNFIHAATPIGIGFSVVVVVIAALNLVLDFDMIDNACEQGLQKHMEWYGAFALMVTLIWLYMEILRLLAKTRRR